MTYTTDAFNNFRRSFKISSVELADFVGTTRRFMLQVETGHEPVCAWMFDAIKKMKERR